MKTILSTLLSAALTSAAFSEVPSLINYQGRLTDANGAAVTGTKNFSISIFSAATGGNLLYSETIGAVTLDANGVYSFQFGGTGTSNTQVTETVASTDGTATTFQKVLANSPVVAGSVSVSDGTYTWSQSAGSSNEDDFGVAYSTSLRRVTANYYNGVPAAGRTIMATYRYGTSGITGALASGSEHWMALSVDSVVQDTRQRVLAVPFAEFSNQSAQANSLKSRSNVAKSLMSFSKIFAAGPNVDSSRSNFQLPLNGSVSYNGGSGTRYNLERIINTNEIAQINTIEATVANTSGSENGWTGDGLTSISLISISPTLGKVSVAQTSTNKSGLMILSGPFIINEENEYLIEVSLETVKTSSYSGVSAGTSSAIKNVRFFYDTK